MAVGEERALAADRLPQSPPLALRRDQERGVQTRQRIGRHEPRPPDEIEHPPLVCRVPLVHHSSGAESVPRAPCSHYRPRPE